VYVTHLFQPNDDYQRVFEYLEGRDNFFYLNSSNLEEMPTSGGQDAIKEVLRKQIEPAEVVIMPIAIFDANPDLTRFQLAVAKASKKPILAIKAFGETVVISKEIIDSCDDLIDWNDRTMISAIKKLSRDEDTAQWEVIEFDLD
jgi:nucleoside 2-deoxyribosyltransferase